jgi:hypothetical protein
MSKAFLFILGFGAGIFCQYIPRTNFWDDLLLVLLVMLFFPGFARWVAFHLGAIYGHARRWFLKGYDSTGSVL